MKTSLSLSHCQKEQCLALGSTGDAAIESDRDLAVCLPAVTAPFATCSLSSPPSPSYLPQAVIQNPFSNGGSPAGEAVGGETRFAYFPATAVSDGTVSVQAASDPQLTQAGGESLPPRHRTALWSILPSEQQADFSVDLN